MADEIQFTIEETVVTFPQVNDEIIFSVEESHNITFVIEADLSAPSDINIIFDVVEEVVEIIQPPDFQIDFTIQEEESVIFDLEGVGAPGPPGPPGAGLQTLSIIIDPGESREVGRASTDFGRKWIIDLQDTTTSEEYLFEILAKYFLRTSEVEYSKYGCSGDDLEYSLNVLYDIDTEELYIQIENTSVNQIKVLSTLIR